MAVWVGKGNGREKTATCGSDGHEMNGWAVSLALHSLSFFCFPLRLCSAAAVLCWEGCHGMAVWAGKGNGREETATCGRDGHEMNGWAASLALHSLSFLLLSPPLVLC